MVLNRISNIGEGRKLKDLEALARLVNTFEPEIEDLSDDELRAKTPEFRERPSGLSGTPPLESVLEPPIAR